MGVCCKRAKGRNRTTISGLFCDSDLICLSVLFGAGKLASENLSFNCESGVPLPLGYSPDLQMCVLWGRQDLNLHLAS